jgi:hypothetical protein
MMTMDILAAGDRYILFKYDGESLAQLIDSVTSTVVVNLLLARFFSFQP